MAQFNEYKSKLNYTTCNEDSSTEMRALNVVETDTVLCLTGSGGPVLNLLLENPKKIIAIDFNPIQNWLLELKIAAIKNLTYEEFSGFLGLKECKDRISLFGRLRGELSDFGLKYWEEKIGEIKRGILFRGELEKSYKVTSNLLKVTMEEKLDKMFSFDDLEDQVQFYDEHWKVDPNWQAFLSRGKSFYFRSDREIEPAYDYLGEDYNFENFILQLADKGFRRHLVKNNHLLALSLDGNYDRVSILPLWLQRDNFNKLKNSIHKVEIVTDDIVSYLTNFSSEIDKFAISNVTDYLKEDDYNNLYRHIINCSKNNGRLCARSIVERPFPDLYLKNIIRDSELETELEEKDLALEYKIIVGSILK